MPSARFEARGSGGQHPPVGATGVSPGVGRPQCSLVEGRLRPCCGGSAA
jgi:hypothetical protein